MRQLSENDLTMQDDGKKRLSLSVEEVSSQRIERSLRLASAGERWPGATVNSLLHLTQKIEQTTE